MHDLQKKWSVAQESMITFSMDDLWCSLITMQDVRGIGND